MFMPSLCDNRLRGAAMQLVPLESSSLASAGYDPALRRLELLFHSGERYLYFQVPPQIYQQFMRAESKGAWFNRNIRNRFPYQHLSPSHTPIVLPAHHKTK
jgi:hypothetical protein